jgi:copper chaperone CopZ
MEHKTFTVPNIGCDGCVRTIQNELSELPGVKKVDAVMTTKTVTVDWEPPATWQKIVDTLNAIDYAPETA